MKIIFPLFIYLFLSIGTAKAAIELTILEPAGIARNNAPVTYGIPISKSSDIRSVSSLQITTDIDGNNPIDAQFRVLSRYNDTPSGTGPIRSVLVDFQTSIAPNALKTVYLQTSGGTGSSSGLLALMNAANLIISTGSMEVKMDNATGWFSSILIDADGDSVVDDELLGNVSQDGFVIRGINGKNYASRGGVVDLVVEENGLLRCVVKATGYFVDDTNGRLIPSNADNGLEYTIRYSFYKNKQFVKIDATLKNENLGWTNSPDLYPTHYIYIDHASLKLTTAIDGSNEIVSFGSDTYSGRASYSLHMSEASDGSFQGYTWEKSVNGAAPTNEQFESFVDVRDSSAGVMAGMRWFWQQHPKAFRIEGGGNEVFIDLWPDQANNHRILGGMWKTHEVLLYFHEANATDHTNVLASLQNRLIARPSDTYIAQSNFFYSIPPETISTDYTFHALEPSLSQILAQDNDIRRAKIDSAFVEHSTYSYSLPELRSGRLVPGPGSPAWWTWYGWLEFGNFPRGSSVWGYSSAHYDWPYSTLVSWLRFADYDYFNLAEELVSHQADISILHDQNAVAQRTWGDRFHGGHRYEHDALFSFHDTYSESKKNAPATGSHFWSKGLALQYLLTGDFRYLDSLEDTVEGRIHNYFVEANCTIDCSGRGYTLREVGRSLEGIITGYIVTGNPDYLARALLVYQNALATEAIPHGSGEFFQSPVGKREASLLQSGTTIEPLIQLYHQLKQVGDTVNANAVKSSLEKQGIWYRDTIYAHSNCSNGDSGTYVGPEYITFGQCKEWDRETLYDCGTCSTTVSFGYFFGRKYAADLFAFLYNVGYGEQWLNLARSVFKDEVTYGTDYIGQVALSNTVRQSRGWSRTISSGDAWAKDSQILKKGLYYMHTEWSSSSVPKILKIIISQ